MKGFKSGVVLILGLGTAMPVPAQLIEEIVVTARRQEESLQETPVAVSALSAEDMADAGISDIQNIREIVPGLQIASSGAKNPSIYIRGIGQRGERSDQAPGVGQYLNGIYIARQDAALLDAVDVASVQVLRGPQGTLFGKNSTGGAMLVTTKAPDPSARSLDLVAKVGNFGRADVKLSGNEPLLDGRAGLRYSVLRKTYDGFLSDAVTGRQFGDENRTAATARFNMDIVDGWNLDVFGFWTRQDEASVAYTCRLQTPDSILMGQAILPGQNQDMSTADRCRLSEELSRQYQVLNSPQDSIVQMDSVLSALTVNGRLGGLDLESITAWSWQTNINRREDHDGLDYNIITQSPPLLYDALRATGLPVPKEDRQQFSQEFKFHGVSGPDQALNYTFGLFLASEILKNTPRARAVGPGGLFGLSESDLVAVLGGVPNPVPVSASAVPLLVPQMTNSDLNNFSAALFAQMNWRFATQWELSLGLRYTRDRKIRDLVSYDPDFQAYADSLNARLAAQGSPSRTAYAESNAFVPLPVDQFHLLGPIPPPILLDPVPTAAHAERIFSQLTPSVTLSHFLGPKGLELLGLDSGMAYLTFSQGFKAGGLDLFGTDIRPYEAELVDNYELGFKLDGLGSRLRLNTAIFYMKYKEMHVEVAQAAGLTPINFIANAGASTIQGIELELTSIPVANLLAMLSVSFTDADLVDYTIESESGFEDRSDEPFALIPKTTVSLSLQYEMAAAGGQLVPRLSYYWRDDIYTGLDADSILYESSTIDAVGILHGRLSFERDNYRITGFVSNLTNAFYYDGGLAITRPYGAAMQRVAPPRTFGMEFSFAF